MTTQEIFEILSKKMTANENVHIIGEPHKVPHGGIAIDAQCLNGEYYSINCFQTYGTDEIKSNAESILSEKYVSFAPKSPYMKMMKAGLYRKKMAYAATVRVVPLEEEVIKCFQELAWNEDYLGSFLFLRFMKENGQFLTLWDINEIEDISIFRQYTH